MSSALSLNRSAALASIGVAVLLVGLKAWAAWSTGSTAMLGSLADTVLDLVASLATLAGVWVVHPPEAGITSYADVPLWVYGLGLLLSLPLSMLLWEKGKLYSAGEGLKGAASAPDPR